MNDLWHNEDETAKVGFALRITLLMAFNGLRNIVSRFPADHTAGGPGQNGCIYAREENGVLVPVCIVGQFFADLGLLRVLLTQGQGYKGTLSDAANASERGSEDNFVLCNLAGLDTSLREMLESTYGITFDDDAFEFLLNAQASQDNGNTWPDAFETAAECAVRKRHVPETRTGVERLNLALEHSA